ncbi:MAG: hypothetical protein JNL01_14480 [Bdellovibrionales bacterium]|nr:hypothetical protein [Bdellovibrionales bacterium]
MKTRLRIGSWIQLGVIALSVGFAVSVRMGWLKIGFMTPSAVQTPADYLERSAESHRPFSRFYQPQRENRIPAFEENSILKLHLATSETGQGRIEYDWLNSTHYKVSVQVTESDWVTRSTCDWKSQQIRFTEPTQKNPLWIAAQSDSFQLVSACKKNPDRQEQEKLLEQHLQYRILETAGFAVPLARLVWITSKNQPNYAMILEPAEDLAFRYGWKPVPKAEVASDQDRIDTLISKNRFDPRAFSQIRVANLFLANPDYSLYGYRTYVMGSGRDLDYIEAWVPYGFENTGLTSGRSEIFNFLEEESFKRSLPALWDDPEVSGYDSDSLAVAASLIAKAEPQIRKLIDAHPARHHEKFHYHLDQWMSAYRALPASLKR